MQIVSFSACAKIKSILYMHDIASACIFLKEAYRFFLDKVIQNLLLTNLKLAYIVFKQLITSSPLVLNIVSCNILS